jgi:pimeloyl-ACP methyl ester carboxylesterase
MVDTVLGVRYTPFRKLLLALFYVFTSSIVCGGRILFIMRVKRRLIGTAAVLLVIVAGFFYQAAGVRKDLKDMAPPGQMIDINRHSIHIYSNGNKESKYTVVLTAGSGTTSPYADFYPLYIRLNDTRRVVLYERPGYGWSEQTASGRDIDTVTQELHELLIKSGEKGPYILVAHSLGSLEIIRFAQLYPGEVAGLVMLEGVSPEYARDFRNSPLRKLSWGAMSLAKNSGVLRGLSRLGVTDKLFIDIEDLPQELRELKVAMALKNMNNRNMKDEMNAMSSNGRKVLEGGSLGDMPMLQFSATNNGYKNWELTQQQLSSLSTRTRRVIFADTKHYIHHEKSGEIVAELNKFLSSL